jgi:hypothetical protein
VVTRTDRSGPWKREEDEPRRSLRQAGSRLVAAPGRMQTSRPVLRTPRTRREAGTPVGPERLLPRVFDMLSRIGATGP